MIILAFLSIVFYLLSLYRGFLIYPGFLMQAAYMLMRGIQLERLPLVGPHDTLFFLSSSLVAFAIPFTFSMKNKKQFINPVSVIASALVVFSLLAKAHNRPLPPVLKTYWFELHVSLSFFSYALFGIAAILGFLFLRYKEQETEAYQYKAVLIGYCMFSLSMIFGGIWAYLAWGTYWLWTPKELWTTILWIFYSLYLHARLKKEWAGKPSAILGIIGFVITLFTYLGVSLLMKSSHTF
ncbi:MAG: cytochrome c biogenesis protein CcsA [Nitrospirae bacterium]|nr:cytochrome c biogenesis protein CcsA [Nitrospirota bacterium]